MGCADGTYVISNKTADTVWWAYYGNSDSDTYTDTVIQVDAHAIATGKSMEYGLIFRVSPDGKGFYRFTILPSGAYSVKSYDDGNWYDLISYENSSDIKPDLATNQLKVIAQGDQLAFYANDQYLGRVADRQLHSGKVGVLMYNGDPNGKVAFDNLTIAKINRPIDLPAPRFNLPPPTALPKPAGPSCADTPAGMAGLLWINQFDGEATITIVDHEYHVPGNTRMLIPIPAGRKFVIDAFIPGVGRLRPAPGPFTWDPGYCEVWSPGRAAN